MRSFASLLPPVIQRHLLWSWSNFTIHCSLPVHRMRGLCEWRCKHTDYRCHLTLITAVKNVYLPWVDCVLRWNVLVCLVCVCVLCVRACLNTFTLPSHMERRYQKIRKCIMRFLYAISVHFLADTQIYCGEKVIDELTRDSDLLASVQETLKNWTPNITSRMLHANFDVLLKTAHLLIY